MCHVPCHKYETLFKKEVRMATSQKTHQSSQILNKNADSKKKKKFSYSAGIELDTSECKSNMMLNTTFTADEQYLKILKASIYPVQIKIF